MSNVEQIVHKQPVPKSPLVGIVVKTLHLELYMAESIRRAIELGNYDGYGNDIIRTFALDEVGLTEVASVDLVQFDRDPNYQEILAWAEENGEKKPIRPKEIFGIGIKHPDEQRKYPIVGVGSVRRGGVLYLRGDSGSRYLNADSVEGRWNRICRFGFLG